MDAFASGCLDDCFQAAIREEAPGHQLGLLFQDDSGLPDPPAVLLEQLAAAANSGTDYVAAVQSLPQPLVDEATGWLTGIVDSLLLDSNRLLRVAS